MQFRAHKHIPQLWVQLFQENLGTGQIAKKLEGTLRTTIATFL